MKFIADMDPRTGQWCVLQILGSRAVRQKFGSRSLFSTRSALRNRLRELGMKLNKDNTVTVQEQK